MSKLANFWNENKGLFLFLFLMLFFRSAIADWYHVPSGSMQPTILIGDRVFVNKLAYDVKIPFTDINLKRHAEPRRGDVIVFDSKASNDRLIKRVIGISGDKIEMR
ncbi:MAG: signal peptidase I, partial [Kangiellaceae bacterium]|nr:signal peptidase I [Kangiellaceae bacterium]